MNYDNETKELIEQLDKQAKQIQAKIDELKNAKSSNVRWRAERIGYTERYCDKNKYYFVYQDGRIEWDVDSAKLSEISNFRHITGNYFENLKEAEQYKQRLIITQQLKDIALRLNDGVEIDWNNYNQNKYGMYLALAIKVPYRLEQGRWTYIKTQGAIYCLSDKFLETSIKEIGEKELIEYIKEI